MSKKLKSYYVKTFGCAMNVADAERIAGWYEKKGWKKAKKMEEADEIVIVSCSVRQSADNRVFGLVNNLAKLKAHPPIRRAKFKVILTGCMLRYPLRYLREKLSAVDEFVISSKFKVPLQGKQSAKLHRHSSETHAYVPIMEGCNNFCSYCVVPYARGEEKSRPFGEIVCEVKELAERGYQEITLLGQNVNSYGNDIQNFKFEILNLKSPKNLPRKLTGQAIFKDQIFKTKFKRPFAVLLKALNKIPGIEKISFLTSNPWDLDDEIIEAMALPKIDRYLHLPVQSGDDIVLKKMNRKYSAKNYLELVDKIRKRIPDIKIGTDIIVGFPGETEEQFQNTVGLCKKASFVKAYIAMYSPRAGTSAFRLRDDIPYKEKKKRWKVLQELINK